MAAATSPCNRNRLRALALGGIFVWAAACSPTGATPSDSGSAHCQPGELKECACTNGSEGMQTCTDTGAYGACSGCGESTITLADASAPTTSPVPSSTSTGSPSSTSPTATTAPTTSAAPTSEPTAPSTTSTSEPPSPPPSSTDAGSTTDPTQQPDSTEVPAGDHCVPVANWDPLWSQWEEEVLLLVNERRAQGANCGTQGTFPPVPPLTMNESLRCAARLHSMDMAVRNFFDHDNPDGVGFSDRIMDAGYYGFAMGENIAAGQESPQAVVEGWMESDGHCSNIMQDVFTDIGVGFYHETEYPNFYWTEDFGG